MLQHIATHTYTGTCPLREDKTKLKHTATRWQHTATHCNTLQHTATHCNTLQHTLRRAVTHCNTLQHTLRRAVTHCNTLQHILAHRNKSKKRPNRVATHCITLHHTATHCNTLQHTATHTCPSRPEQERAKQGYSSQDDPADNTLHTHTTHITHTHDTPLLKSQRLRHFEFAHRSAQQSAHEPDRVHCLWN